MKLIKLIPVLAMLNIATAHAYTASCQVGYTKSNSGAQLFGPQTGQFCNFGVTFGTASGGTDRVYGCFVARGASSCTVTIPAVTDTTVPTGWMPYSAWSVQPNTTADINRGCLPAKGYPSARVSGLEHTNHLPLSSDTGNVYIIHRYQCK